MTLAPREPPLVTPSASVHRLADRSAYCACVARECQLAIGSLQQSTGGTAIKRLTAFVESLPEPTDPSERFYLRSMLLDFALNLVTHLQASSVHSVDAAIIRRLALNGRESMDPKGGFLRFAVSLFEPPESAHSESAGTRLQREIESQYLRRVTVASLARAVGLKPRSADRQFRREQGESIHAYLTRIRVRRAVALIQAGEKAEAIAKAVGYGSRKDLYRAVQKLTGQRVCELREAAKNR